MLLEVLGQSGLVNISSYQTQGAATRVKKYGEREVAYTGFNATYINRQLQFRDIEYFTPSTRDGSAKVRITKQTESYSYWVDEPGPIVTHTGVVIAQTVLSPRAFILSQIGAYFDQLDVTGDVTVMVTLTKEGKPDLDNVISKVTVARSALVNGGAETVCALPPTPIDAGVLYGIVFVTAGGHKIVVSDAGYTEGQFYYGQDGDWVSTDASKDIKLRLYANKFNRTVRRRLHAVLRRHRLHHLPSDLDRAAYWCGSSLGPSHHDGLCRLRRSRRSGLPADRGKEGWRDLMIILKPLKPIYNGIAAHFPMRRSEWIMLMPTFGMWLALQISPEMFSTSPSFSTLQRIQEWTNRFGWTAEEVWRAIVLACGVVRLAALTVNGSFHQFRFSPHLRFVASGAGLVFWSQWTLGFITTFLTEGAGLSAVVAYGTFCVLELANVYTSSQDIGGEVKRLKGGPTSADRL